jgi:hypothetical protein
VADVRIVFEELAGVFPALADSLGLVAEPGPALLDDIVLHAQIDHLALFRDPFAVYDVEFGFTKNILQQVVRAPLKNEALRYATSVAIDEILAAHEEWFLLYSLQDIEVPH